MLGELRDAEVWFGVLEDGELSFGSVDVSGWGRQDGGLACDFASRGVRSSCELFGLRSARLVGISIAKTPLAGGRSGVLSNVLDGSFSKQVFILGRYQYSW